MNFSSTDTNITAIRKTHYWDSTSQCSRGGFKCELCTKIKWNQIEVLSQWLLTWNFNVQSVKAKESERNGQQVPIGAKASNHTRIVN